MNAYTISSGIFPKYLNGENIISVPLAENETMQADDFVAKIKEEVETKSK